MEIAIRQLTRFRTCCFVLVFLLNARSYGDPPLATPDITLFKTPYISLNKVAGQLGMKYQLSNCLLYTSDAADE